MSISGTATDPLDFPGAQSELVSVIIPVYNRLELLPRTLQSVLNQTYGNLEVIIVDDGSSLDVKGELDKVNDVRINYTKHEINKGVAAAWNTGINAAQGNYVTFLGSDDEWSETKVEKEVAELRERGTEYQVTYCLSEIYSDIESRVLERRTFDLEGDIQHQLLCRCAIGLNSIMISKEDLLQVGAFDERLRMHSDWDFMIRLSSRYRFSCVREVLNRDHWHEFDQITKGYRMSPEYDSIIYERNRALFEADGEARAIYFSNLAYYEGLHGRKKEALGALARSMLANPMTSDPYIKFILLVTNRFEEPKIIR